MCTSCEVERDKWHATHARIVLSRGVAERDVHQLKLRHAMPRCGARWARFCHLGCLIESSTSGQLPRASWEKLQ
jgi:hypothetical protein